MASLYKGAERQKTSKESAEVAKAFQTIYKRGPLKWPQLLQVDPGREFMGAVTIEMENHKLKQLFIALLNAFLLDRTFLATFAYL